LIAAPTLHAKDLNEAVEDAENEVADLTMAGSSAKCYAIGRRDKVPI